MGDTLPDGLTVTVAEIVGDIVPVTEDDADGVGVTVTLEEYVGGVLLTNMASIKMIAPLPPDITEVKTNRKKVQGPLRGEFTAKSS